jgi:hypothetical protein
VQLLIAKFHANSTQIPRVLHARFIVLPRRAL